MNTFLKLLHALRQGLSGMFAPDMGCALAGE
jgi:hypothetical protein